MIDPNLIDDEFKVLSPRDHCLAKPGMFVGSTALEQHELYVSGMLKQVKYVPALIKIINEIIDNSLDESIRTKFKNANAISIDIVGNRVTIEDNGRGIPQDLIKDLDGSEILRPLAAWTRTNAGSNFNDQREGIGSHGVGAALTNFFSQSFHGITSDGKHTATISCSNNCDPDRISVHVTPSKLKGTKVSFIPDFNQFGVFGISKDDVAIVKDRIETLAVAYPEIKFRFNGKPVQGSPKIYAKRYGATQYQEDGNVICFIAPSLEFRQVSFVNGVGTSNGGTHVDYFMNRLNDELSPMVKAKYKVPVTKAMLKQGMALGFFLRGFKNPKFDSQTKERLTNAQSELSPYLKDFNYSKFAKKLVADDDIMMPIIETLVAKRLAADARELASKNKEAKSASVDGHLKASKRGGRLFLAEGKSAIGYLMKVRNNEVHGGYALRGKPMCTWKEPNSKIIKNQELFDIMSILNIELGNQDISNMYYDDIGILVDADTDGVGSIFPLLLVFFYKWKELFELDKIKFIKTPVIIATKGTGKTATTKWYYDLKEYRKAKLSNIWKIRYIKGLGSLTEKEYHRVINEPVYDTIKIDDPDMFNLLFDKKSADRRKEWMSA